MALTTASSDLRTDGPRETEVAHALCCRKLISSGLGSPSGPMISSAGLLLSADLITSLKSLIPGSREHRYKSISRSL